MNEEPTDSDALPAIPLEPPQSVLNSEQKTFALCSYLLPVVTNSNFIAPLIIWLIKKDTDAYISEHAKESLNFQISFCIYAIIAYISIFLLVGFLLFPAVMIAYIVFSIIGSVKAYQGEPYSVPVIFRFIK